MFGFMCIYANILWLRTIARIQISIWTVLLIFCHKFRSIGHTMLFINVTAYKVTGKLAEIHSFSVFP